MQAQNPLVSKAVPALATGALAVLGGVKAAAFGLGLTSLNSGVSGIRGETIGGRKLGLPERIARTMDFVAGGAGFSGTVRAAGRDIYEAAQNGQLERLFDRFANRVAQAVTQNPPQVSSHDVAHVTAVQATRVRPVP
jgi:hypothetical protein